MKLFQHGILIGNIIGIITLFLVFLLAINTVNRFQENASLTRASHVFLEKTQNVETLSIRLQSSARGYVLSKNPIYKTKISSTTADINMELEQLDSLVTNNALQKAYVDSLIVLINRRVLHSERLISLTDVQSNIVAIDLMKTGVGNEISEQTISLLEELEEDEEQLLLLREQALKQSEENFIITAIASLLFVLLLFFFLTWQIYRGNQKTQIYQVKLVQRENFLADIINYNSANIHVKDLEGRYILVNDSLEKTVNIPKNQMVGKADHELFPEAEAKQYMEAEMRVIESKKIVEVEETMILNDGLHFFQTTKFPMFDKRQKLYAIGTISTDITARRALNHVRAKTAVLFENSAQGIVISDDNGMMVLVNPRAEQLFGYKKDEMLGLSVDSLVPDRMSSPDIAQSKGFAHRPSANAMGMNRDLIGKIKSGNEFPMEMESSFFYEDKERFMVSFCTDITERKGKEDEILRTNEQLTAVNKELESFSYSVAHDLRSPLRAIAGFSNILLKKNKVKLDQEAQRLLKEISDDSKRMGNLIDDLLAFSQLGQKSVTKTKIDTSGMVQDVIARMKSSYPDRIIRWKVAKLPRAFGDTNLIRQVWENYINNAVKYSQRMDVAVIEIGNEKSGQNCVYYVKDNGVGFDENHSSKLFEVFQRLHGHDEFEGTGIGLANVKRIVSKHGGNTWAKGQMDKGATFYFSLPIE